MSQYSDKAVVLMWFIICRTNVDTCQPVQLVSLQPWYQPGTPLASWSHRTEHTLSIRHNFREIPQHVN